MLLIFLLVLFIILIFIVIYLSAPIGNRSARKRRIKMKSKIRKMSKSRRKSKIMTRMAPTSTAPDLRARAVGREAKPRPSPNPI